MLDGEIGTKVRRLHIPYSRFLIIPTPPSLDIILEQLARTKVFLGEEGLKKVRKSFVIIVGCGGVGSWVATMLLRSGVGKIRLVDFDQVTLSSLNRHAVATLADVGTPKVQALRKRLEQVAPWVEIDARNELWEMEDGAALLAGEPTFVVDAIDDTQTKVDLLFYCKTHNIPIISSMGAGCKSDPTRVYGPKPLISALVFIDHLHTGARFVLATFQNQLKIHYLEALAGVSDKRVSPPES